MPNPQQFRLPDVGEGLTEADILRWDVAVGDTVTVNQVLVEVETAKAAVELPSPFAGVVAALHVDAGQTVEVGTPIITIDTAPDAAAAGDDPSGPSSSGGQDPAATPGVAEQHALAGEGVPAGGREPVLVGYGPGGRGSRRRVPSAQPSFEPQPAAAAAVRDAVPEPAEPAEPSVPAPDPTPDPARGGSRRGVGVLAKPPVRRLAKSLGVDLADVAPSGPHGTVTRADVEAAASATSPTSGAPSAPSALRALRPAAAGEREERIAVRGVRRHTAAAMVSSAFTAPHVTEFVTVDVTETMALRDRVAARREFADVRVSPLLFVARALLLAVGRNPSVNASWVEDDAGGAEIVVKHYVNLGIAAATDRGLVVPTIKDAHLLSLRELAGAMADLTATARAGRTAPADLTGGTITITNIGVFGIDSGTPILNPGEAAILAVGAVRRAPWVVQRDGVETLEPRWVTQLALSFDHRMVDGAEGSRFLADIAAVLADPGLALL